MLLLDNKHAVAYGAGGPIGAAMARGFACEGARVSLAGRTRAKLDELAQAISAGSGNVADVAQVDAVDEQAILRHADRLAEQIGSSGGCLGG
jgi:3-oxoacyl-[acyl-carrier protein] reductase